MAKRRLRGPGPAKAPACRADGEQTELPERSTRNSGTRARTGDMPPPPGPTMGGESPARASYVVLQGEAPSSASIAAWMQGAVHGLRYSPWWCRKRDRLRSAPAEKERTRVSLERQDGAHRPERARHGAVWSMRGNARTHAHMPSVGLGPRRAGGKPKRRRRCWVPGRKWKEGGEQRGHIDAAVCMGNGPT